MKYGTKTGIEENGKKLLPFNVWWGGNIVHFARSRDEADCVLTERRLEAVKDARFRGRRSKSCPAFSS